MLRRIKKDVENELTDKVEVLVYCPLTIRQKLLYVGLKRKIRIEELLQNLGSQSQINSSLNTSLMNLVMQFRKVSTIVYNFSFSTRIINVVSNLIPVHNVHFVYRLRFWTITI